MKNVKKLQNNTVIVFRDISLKYGIYTINKNKQPIVMSGDKQYSLKNIEITGIKQAIKLGAYYRP